MTSKAAVAGNYAASGGTGDPEFVADRLAEMQSAAREDAVERADHAATREHVETADPDRVDIKVRGETLSCEPLGLGERLRPSKKATVAEERGDDLKAAEAILDMIDILVRVSPAEYDRDFFDTLTESELRDTFRSLGERSKGGNGR